MPLHQRDRVSSLVDGWATNDGSCMWSANWNLCWTAVSSFVINSLHLIAAVLVFMSIIYWFVWNWHEILSSNKRTNFNKLQKLKIWNTKNRCHFENLLTEKYLLIVQREGHAERKFDWRIFLVIFLISHIAMETIFMRVLPWQPSSCNSKCMFRKDCSILRLSLVS